MRGNNLLLIKPRDLPVSPSLFLCREDLEFQVRKRVLAWTALISLLWFAACATAIFPEITKEVDQGISFESLLREPAAFHGKTVLLGGDIIRTENLPEKTLIIILQRSLDSKMRPIGEDRSKGRFIISVPGFLDPAIYRQGREITVVGRVAGEEVRSLDEIEYVYPIIDKRELYLWPVEKSQDSEPRVIFGIGVGIGF